MLLAPDSQARVAQTIKAIAASYAVYMLGSNMGLGALDFAQTQLAASAGDPANLTFLEQAYLAGKAAQQLGPDKIKAMSETELIQWLKDNNITVDAADQAMLDNLKNQTATWLKARSDALQAKIDVEIQAANQEYAGQLANQNPDDVQDPNDPNYDSTRDPNSPDYDPNLVPDDATDEDARDAALSDLLDNIDEQADSFTSDVERLSVSQMALWFQTGLVVGRSGEEYVYKIPRPTACEYCMELHLNPDGSPIIYPLSEVLGNSNIGRKPDEWDFVIGPVHPWCYCTLYFVNDNPPPDASDEWSSIYSQTMGKSMATHQLKWATRGPTNDPDNLFDDYVMFKHDHVHDRPAYVNAMINAVKTIYGDKLPGK